MGMECRSWEQKVQLVGAEEMAKRQNSLHTSFLTVLAPSLLWLFGAFSFFLLPLYILRSIPPSFPSSFSSNLPSLLLSSASSSHGVHGASRAAIVQDIPSLLMVSCAHTEGCWEKQAASSDTRRRHVQSIHTQTNSSRHKVQAHRNIFISKCTGYTFMQMKNTEKTGDLSDLLLQRRFHYHKQQLWKAWSLICECSFLYNHRIYKQ